MAFASSVFATTAAGFGAAQGIADTALSAHATELAMNLKKAELMNVHVQMGKLHISLGLVGYLAGVAAASMSLSSSYNNWQDATRRGNREAQVGATLQHELPPGPPQAHVYPRYFSASIWRGLYLPRWNCPAAGTTTATT
jgi:hypothetical protein